MPHKLVKTRLEARGVRLDSFLAVVYLTGGGSLLSGICELAEDVFSIAAPRVRLKGFSTVSSALENPRLSCALGLVKLVAGIEASKMASRRGCIRFRTRTWACSPEASES